MAVIIITPLTLAINRRKLGEEGGSENWRENSQGSEFQLGVALSLSAENDP